MSYEKKSPFASETFSLRKTLSVVPEDLFFHVLQPKLLMLEICLLFETICQPTLFTCKAKLAGLRMKEKLSWDHLVSFCHSKEICQAVNSPKK